MVHAFKSFEEALSKMYPLWKSMLVELGGQIALCIMEALMVTVNEHGMSISAVTILLHACL